MSKKKGDILEEIIAELHSVPGVHLTRNARLKSLAGKGRGRDIDVLIEANVAGHEVQIAIECKNERRKIGAPKIDGFAGKLIEVGIPTRHGIFVSTSGFTVDALQSAATHRIRPLVLAGLALDGLRDEIGRALCSTVYLLADVVSYAIENSAPKASLSELNFLYAGGKFEGLVLDRFAQLWIEEKIPSVLGKHSVELPLTQGTYQVAEGKMFEVRRVTAEIEVIGLVFQLGGRAVQHALIDPLTQSVHKLRATITPSAPTCVRVPLTVVRTDDDVQQLCMPSDASSVVAHIRLPRIRYGPAYWPLSRRVMAKMRQAAEAYQRGEGPDPSRLTFNDIESDDLAENFRF
ncbi:MAG TPA: restriction endonuclease [Thermoanaerobaculia bacterium]|nr:restriction endonuclease [Thermoanaerobaculia bacterium]